MKLKIRIISLILVAIIAITTSIFAITEVDNGVMKIFIRTRGYEFDGLHSFDVKGYITTDEATGEKTLISSTFGNHGYHTFLNVNGKNGEMSGELTYTDRDELQTRLLAMQYTAYNAENEWQNIDGIDLKVNTMFINNGEQLQIIYTLKNTTTSSLTYSLATTADVQIDGDDRATIERLEDGSGVRLWTKEGYTDKPVQFVFYGKDVNGATDVDNLWIGSWRNTYMTNMFNNNPEETKVENWDSAFTYSWVNRTINAGETKTYSVLMEVGEINIPNTGIVLDDNTKFYYTDVKINGTVIDADLKDNIVIHYVVDGTEYTLPAMSTTGTSKDFVLDLTPLSLSAGTEHSLKVWATDSTDCESNVEERTFTVTYLKNPELSVSETDWAKDVTFKISDTVNEEQYVDKYQYRINNGSWVDCQKDTDIPIQESGILQIDARIVGTETNDYSDIITKTAKVDKVNPTNTVPTASKTTCSITVISAQTDEHSGIDETKTMYAIKIGDNWSDWQSNNTFTGLIHNTEYVVKTKSTDMVGNSGESQELTVKTDELLLGNLILKLNNNEGANYTEDTWTNQNIYVAVEENSVGATTKYYSKENSAETIVATNQETTVTADGTTTLLLSVTDGTNTITSDVEHILKVDKIAPVINELSLDNEEWTTTGKVITGKAVDGLSGIVAYQFSNQDNITVSSNGWNNIENTNNEITQTLEVNESGKYYFYVKDAAGNIASVSIDTKIDGLGPVITFTRANGETIINVTDTGSGVKTIQYAWTTENVEPNSENWVDYTEAVTYNGTSKGTIYLWAIAKDNAENTTTSSTIFNEIKKPEILAEDEFVNEYASFKLNSENQDEDITYQFKIDDGEWQNINKDSLYTITNITDGEIKISARVLDNAGRYSEISTKTVTVTILEPLPPEEDNNTNDSNPGDQEDNDNNNSNNGGNENTGTNTNKPNSSDKTTAGGSLPHTGLNTLTVISIVTLVIGAIFAYRKVKFYKDIK